MLKKIGYGFLAALVIAQFIRPSRNQSEGPFPNDISNKVTIPADVATILKTSCNDCHSNNTHYPWYAMVQPLGWWLQRHVNEGKEHLNFNEFASYSAKKQDHKLEEVAETVTNGEMPLTSYTFIHRGAKLSAEQVAALQKWVTESRTLYRTPEQPAGENGVAK
ncbi:MAG TPA: heme-binding domain-containing protein [Lacibacter sp.]|nr:heme-binding domain-containing protein [Lacibacter sp.]HMO89262.1 heme-binding domain-containing protein [Lacibacter sp.]HMP87318.1 heme-binding domain-containing protein [Lacibacter sp.]